jgi:hypothetical protein
VANVESRRAVLSLSSPSSSSESALLLFLIVLTGCPACLSLAQPSRRCAANRGQADQNIEKAMPPCGKMFAHRPSFMSYYAESMVCFEEGRDLCAGPTMKAMEL